jgi:hypothetical protein
MLLKSRVKYILLAFDDIQSEAIQFAELELVFLAFNAMCEVFDVFIWLF